MTPAVCSSEDRPRLTDNCSIIRVGEGDPCEIRLCPACLRDPVVPAIGCSENYTSSAHNCSGISIRKGNPHKRTGSPVWLACPSASSVCCSQNYPCNSVKIKSNRCSIICIGKRDAPEVRLC